MGVIYERQPLGEEKKKKKEEQEKRALKNAQGLVTKNVIFNPAEHVGSSIESAQRKKIQKLEKKYDIDASTFGRDEFVDWAEKHNFENAFIDAFGGAMYEPKGQLQIGSFIKLGKKQTTEEEEADAEVLGQIAGNNERRKTAQGIDNMDNLDGVTMAALTGFGDGLSLGFATKIEDSKKKKAYLAAGLPASDYVSTKNDIYDKNNKNHPYANLAGDIGGSMAAFGAIKSGVAAAGAAGAKAIKAATGLQKVEKVAGVANAATQIGGTVSKATKGVEWISKNREWVQAALELGVTNAVVSGGRVAAKDGDAKAVAQASAAGFAGGLAGSAASEAVGRIGANILFNKGLRDALIPNIILGGATGASYAAGQTGVSYLLYPEGYKPKKNEIARDMAVAFAIGAFSYSYNTAKISNESRQYLENAKDKISDDYEAISKCYAEALMNTRDPEEALGLMEDYARNIRKYNEDVKSFITGRDVQFVGQKKYVDNILEALEEVSQAVDGKIYEFSEWTNGRNASSGSGAASSGAAFSAPAATMATPQIPAIGGTKTQVPQPITIATTASQFRQSPLSKEERASVNEVARVIGAKVKIADQTKGIVTNEKYEYGVTYLAENADDPLRSVFAHKMVRYMKDNSPRTYNKYLKLVRDTLTAESGLSWAELQRQTRERYAEQGIELSAYGVNEELAAGFNMRILTDANNMAEMLKNAKNLNEFQKYSLANRLINPIKAMTNRLENYSRNTGRSIAESEIAELKSTQQQLENIVAGKAWNQENRAGTVDSGIYDVLEDAGDTYAAVGADSKVQLGGAPKLSSPLTDTEAVIAPRRNVAGSGVDISDRSGIIKSITVDDVDVAALGKDIDSQVLDIVKKHFAAPGLEKGYYINNIYIKSIPKTETGTPLMQIVARASGRMYETDLVLNEDLFRGRNIEGLNESLIKFKGNLPETFEEAVIHEVGHAKAIFANRFRNIDELYSILSNMGVDGVSDIALEDGVEAVAEIEVLIHRGSEVPQEAQELYDKVMRGEL